MHSQAKLTHMHPALIGRTDYLKYQLTLQLFLFPLQWMTETEWEKVHRRCLPNLSSSATSSPPPNLTNIAISTPPPNLSSSATSNPPPNLSSKTPSPNSPCFSQRTNLAVGLLAYFTTSLNKQKAHWVCCINMYCPGIKPILMFGFVYLLLWCNNKELPCCVSSTAAKVRTRTAPRNRSPTLANLALAQVWH